MLASLLAALEHRAKTGEGQHVDVSQAEAAIHLLAPAILDYELNGRIWHRMGNRDLQLSPHGVYRAAGEDRDQAEEAVDRDHAQGEVLEALQNGRGAHDH